MRTVVLLGDGMGDYPIVELNNRTPLQVAAIPNIRRMATGGDVRLVRTIPDGMSPGSDVANLSMMGFDPRVYYTGRAPIEAAGAGLTPEAADVVFRCNLIAIHDGTIVDHSSGHITTEEGARIIETLDRELGDNQLRFRPGAGYRHLLLWRNGPIDPATVPPHDVLGQPMEHHLPRGTGADAIIRLMNASRDILANHPVNEARRRAGKTCATQIWLWGQGRRTILPSYRELFGLTGGVISAVDLLRGIGILAGLEAPRIPGATGFIDTNFAGKVSAAKKMLTDGHDFIFLHIEAPDECGHMGDLYQKIRAIEAFDDKIVGPIWRELQSSGKAPWQIIVATDHRTPISVRGHTIEPVPLMVYDSNMVAAGTDGRYDEFVDGGQARELAFDCMNRLLKGEKNA